MRNRVRAAPVLAVLLAAQAVAIWLLRVPHAEPPVRLETPPRTRPAPDFGAGLPTGRFVALTMAALSPGPGDPTAPTAVLAQALAARGAPAAEALAAAARGSDDGALRGRALALLREAGFPPDG